MSLSPEIRDQAYQFFIEEAAELLQTIEMGLLDLRQDHTTVKIHEVMRAAHSIKGGAASVELNAITTISHRLETIFKALYHESVVFDAELESALLKGFDCLRIPLTEQIETGQMDEAGALAQADHVLVHLEAKLGDALKETDNYVPTSADLGVDIVASIFEVDVTQALERLTAVQANPTAYPVAGELKAQLEVFTGLAEILNLPGFGEITQVALTAIETNPDRVLDILGVVLADFRAAHELVLAGDRTQGGSPSDQLRQLAEVSSGNIWGDQTEPVLQDIWSDQTETALEDIWGDPVTATNNIWDDSPTPALENIWGDPSPEPALEDIWANQDNAWETAGDNNSDSAFPALTDVFGEGTSTEGIITEGITTETPDLEDIFGQPDTIEFPREATTQPSLDDIFSQADPSIEHIPLQQLFFSDFSIDHPPIEEQRFPEDSPGDHAAIEEQPFPEDVFSDHAAIEAQPFAEEILSDHLAVEEQPFLEETVSEHPEPENLWIGHEDTDSVNADEMWLTELEFGVRDSEFGISNPEPQVLDPNLQSMPQALNSEFRTLNSVGEASPNPEPQTSNSEPRTPNPELQSVLHSLTQEFNQLPSVADRPDAAQPLISTPLTVPPTPTPTKAAISNPAKTTSEAASAARSIRIDLSRLERMNNLVGELVINRNSLSLQNEQLQAVVKALNDRFNQFQDMIIQLQDLSDKMLVGSSEFGVRSSEFGMLPMGIASQNSESSRSSLSSNSHPANLSQTFFRVPSPENSEFRIPNSEFRIHFDTLEMDRYDTLHSHLQEIFEEALQLEESLGDVNLFAGQSNQALNRQRQRLNQLQNELMWARMLPLGNVLNRFPRILRDLSNQYHKPVNLQLVGTNVLVDKSILEKLYDPLLHLLRNAFDHGIEAPDIRQQQGKPREGTIELRAYHRGNQTFIEIQDDGRGINFEKIRQRAQELGWLTPEQTETLKSDQLLNFMFEPGFSTAAKVTEISGRGVGLDVVRSELRQLKGTIEVLTTPNQGTTFVLKLPLTLTIVKLLTFLAGSTLMALPSDSIEEILVPQAHQVKRVGKQRFLLWQEQLLPLYSVQQLVHYACFVTDASATTILGAVPTPEDWALPLLVIRRGQQNFALEIDRLLTEQELVIKPFGLAIAPPPYIYGCTILSDGQLVPVIDAILLVERSTESITLTLTEQDTTPESALAQSSPSPSKTALRTILVVDDSSALRRTLALTLQKAGYRVLQARDGLEALDQLRQQPDTNLVICDVEMPHMNGFEFLSQRRRQPELAQIPVVMLTSRSNAKHRQLATQLGAMAYLNKPYIEHELLATLEEIIYGKLIESFVSSL
jgi:chemotaxis family two-component system sensor histidine kinase/response regulator PixL